MLVAEARGKAEGSIENCEDYLTSAVFGHLRYLPPSLFWASLFRRAKQSTSEGVSLNDYLSSFDCAVFSYSSVDVAFWRLHPEFGEPDLLLTFSHPDRQPLTILIEVKLWSSKSGTGKDNDQLCRYFQALEDVAWLGRRQAVPPVLIYLTPHDSQAEIEQSLGYLTSSTDARLRFFQLQWQDVLLAARESAEVSGGWQRVLLTQVAEVLHRRQLEYFRGFDRTFIEDLVEASGLFYGKPK
jgi:hypothetical protein